MAQIITFYSFKGGVGRTMALANVGCLIAARGLKVLLVDWDLEAPGLHHYFAIYSEHTLPDTAGTIGLLEAMAVDRAADSISFESTVKIPKTEFFSGCELSLLAAGMGSHDYESRVLNFDLEGFYRQKKGASKLEALRQTWRSRFDFVLIDSRTGITDTGGVCTIFLPDILALVFTANEQSLAGAIDVARRAQKGRQALSFDRRGLTVFPIPARFDSRTEQEEADLWMKRFSDALSPFLADWCPRDVAPRTFLERIKIPHVPYFSFGEKLPVVTHTLTDPDLPGFYYQNIASVLVGRFAEDSILSVCGIAKKVIADISSITTYAPEQLLGREAETILLSDAWGKAVRGEKKRPHILTFVAPGGEGKTSLVAKWTAELAHQNWPGCDAAFAWSFYSQGTRDHAVASSDTFLKEALIFFGDAAMAGSAAGEFDKGRRLAQLVGERRTLLILDGLEPLQYGPTSTRPGELRDQGLAALLKGLAAASHGLCLVTTRYSIPDLRAYWQTTAPEEKLLRLSKEAGVALLKRLGVKGMQREFETLVEEVKGHPLSLVLLGAYLRDAHGGDIRQRDRVRLEEADAEFQGGQAFRVMHATIRSLENEGERGQRAVALLRLIGLFDRPATTDLLEALWKGEAIPGLTESLVGINDAQRNMVLTRLENANLLTVNRDAAGTLVSLDAHPLLREYFAQQLRQSNPDAWRAAHRRLYEHLCATTKEGDQPTLEDLQPLYQAVAHGCQAGLQQEAGERVYRDRILRRDEYYSVKRLGAMGSDLGAVVCFFEQPWSRVSPALAEAYQAWLLNEAAFRLRALGRLSEALEPMRAGLGNLMKQGDWKSAAAIASNLSELELTLGEVAVSVGDAEQSVTYADRSGDVFLRGAVRGTHGDALHQAGCRAEAQVRFREAEQMRAERQPNYPLMYSVEGFRYCDLLLATSERAAWQTILGLKTENLKLETLTAVSQRGKKMVEGRLPNDALLDIALDHLTLGRAAMYQAILEQSEIGNPKSEIEKAVDGLRRAGTQDHLPRGLLTRAWLRFLAGDAAGAQADLDEAWEIAERGPMRLFLADVHLYRARLFHGVTPYPWDKDEQGKSRGPKDDLAAARKLVEQCGYWRRKEELEDAEEAAKNW